MKKVVVALVVLISAIGLKAQYSLDKSHAKLGFAISHMLVSDVEGQFKIFDVKLTAQKEDLSDANIEVTADINSIDTDDEKRDAHLKNADFFDAPKYPTLNFKSTSYKKEGSDKFKYVLTGNLTMHGVTKTVTLEVTYNGSIVHPYTGKTVLGFKIKGKINRKDFGIAVDTPNSALGEEITISSNIEMVKD